MQPFAQHVFEKFPVLKTNRLTLRQFLPQDAEMVYNMRINPQVNRFISRGPMQHFHEAQELIEKVTGAYQEKKAIGWAALLRDGEKMIGACGFHKIDFNNHRAEIGGEMHPDFWGKNIALEAVKEITRYGLEDMKLRTIEAWIQPQNRSVIYLLESLGFRKEAHLTDYVKKGEVFSDMAIYVLHPEWFSVI